METTKTSLLPPCHSAGMFTWMRYGLRSVGVAEASDFGSTSIDGGRPPQGAFPGDRAMMVRGNSATHRFGFSHSIRDSEGEIVAWVYVTADRRFEVRILND